ncbi:MAG: DIP1984 family protein [Phycisphaeraceae bacterium]|nr:DIP1984 family protein [Phycisphaeraceae bacterium]
MKLAEALLLRADMKKKLESLRSRVASNAVVQEGETPHEDPSELLMQSFGVVKEMQALIARINIANHTNKLEDGRTLADLINQREALAMQHSLITNAVQNSNKEPDRYSMSEIKWVAALDVRSLQKQADDLAINIRELNAIIQEKNWRVELD